MQGENENPFIAPAVTSATPIAELDPTGDLRPFNLSFSVVKWFLICGISGAPSFVMAFSLSEYVVTKCLAMVLGILTYVALYVYIESRERTRQRLKDKSLRIALRVGYGTRVLISIVFPIAIFVDIWCGLASISLTYAIFGSPGFGRGEFARELSTVPLTFIWFYTTTIVQGALLNLVLGAYTLVVYAITVAIRGGLNR